MFNPSELQIKRITKNEDFKIAQIARANLEKAKLNIPGTAYFDKCLDHLSEFYNEKPKLRSYFVLVDENNKVYGGGGLAEFPQIEGPCAELQKLYLIDEAKDFGLGTKLCKLIEEEAKRLGYKKLYLETHSNLNAAINLYKKLNYTLLERPIAPGHQTMDHFFMKDL